MSDMPDQECRGPGSPSFRVNWLLRQLERIFPNIVNPWSSSASDHLLINAAFEQKKELAETKRQLQEANAKLDQFRDLWHKYTAEEIVANLKNDEVPVNFSLESSNKAWYSSHNQAIIQFQADIIKILMD